MENDFKNVLESDTQQQMNDQDEQEVTWEEIFDGVPTAPGTEAAQERHKQLHAQHDMTEEEEAELGELFYTIYPQFRLEACETGQRRNDPRKYSSLCGEETGDSQFRITLALLLLEIYGCWITILHCGVTFHGLVGCVIVVWWCLIVNQLANKKKPKGHF